MSTELLRCHAGLHSVAATTTAAVAALSANLGDDGRALLLLEGAALDTPAEEAWLERCEGSIVSPPSRVALASARGFRGRTEELLAFYDAALHATAAAPAEDLRVVLACRSNGAVARIPCVLKAPDASLVAAWVSSSVEEDGAGAAAMPCASRYSRTKATAPR